jgi:hypothetical protein
MTGTWLSYVIASEAKQSSRAPVGAQEKLESLRSLRFLVGALRARWIASSLRSSQ